MKIIVQLWSTEDFKVEDVDEEEALDEDGVISYTIIAVKLDIMHEIVRIPLTFHVSIVESLTMW